MAGITLQFDPASESSGTPLTIVNTTTHFLTQFDPGTPPEKTQWAASVDTEGSFRAGEPRHENRTATIGLRIMGSSASDLESKIEALSEKLEKCRREGGTLQATWPSGTTAVLDIEAGSMTPVWDKRAVTNHATTVTMQFTAKPYWRGPWETLTAHTETSKPCIVFTETAIKGDVPALAKLQITDLQDESQGFVMWGRQSRYYDSATTAALFYEAETLTPLGSSVAAAGPSGASGSTTNKTIFQTAVPTSWMGIMSTQAVSGGAHMTHVGSYRVWARAYVANQTADLELALEWGTGDQVNVTRNAAAGVLSDDRWHLADLGTITIPDDADQWIGHILARATSGTAATALDLYIDCLFLMPIDEGYGEVSTLYPQPTPSSYLARDDFDGIGALAGRSMPVGGSWSAATGSDTTDFSITSSYARRTAVSDTAKRVMIAGGGTAADTVVQIDFRFDSEVSQPSFGLVARFVDMTNAVYATVTPQSFAAPFGVSALGVGAPGGVGSGLLDYAPLPLNSWHTIRLVALSNGMVLFYLGLNRGALQLVGSTYFASVKTGGSVATGQYGFFDYQYDTNAATRDFTNFMAWTGTMDAALFASRELDLMSDRVRRDSEDGIPASPSRYGGDHFYLHPAGSESRTNRVIVKASRTPPSVGSDPAIDDIQAQVLVQPRYIHGPE